MEKTDFAFDEEYSASAGAESDETLEDYRLTTAEIQYHMPDYPNLVQSYLWQSLDRLPDFPKLNEFLCFWERELEGTLHSVRIGYVGIVPPAEWSFEDSSPNVH